MPNPNGNPASAKAGVRKLGDIVAIQFQTRNLFTGVSVPVARHFMQPFISPQTMTITRQFIDLGASGKCGWTKEQLALLGIVWPPARGWSRRIVGTEIEEAIAHQFLSMRGHKLKRNKELRQKPVANDCQPVHNQSR